MSARNRRAAADRLDPFADKTDLEQVADDIYGASPVPELNTGRVVARPLPLTDIWADVRQPRRAIPASVRLAWNGSPADVPRLLKTWAAVAANAAGRTINIQQIIAGDGDGLDTDGTPAIYESFISLLRLAASIQHDGLINPITVIEERARRLIESGERRWLAYWLLHLHTPTPDDYARIPAATATGDGYVWRQAAENTARRSLNAVGMARQLALLIMAARGQDQYTDFEEIVPPGACDRRFYAQVADGNIHRIPKGAGERIQAAMGLSMVQLSQYRRLLRLMDDDEVNDVLWMRADIEDWPELALRQISTLTVVKVRDVLSRDSWALDDLRPTPPPVSAPPPVPPPSMGGFHIGDWVQAQMSDHALVGKVVSFDHDMERLIVSTDRGTARLRPEGLTLLAYPPAPSAPPRVPPSPPPSPVQHNSPGAAELAEAERLMKQINEGFRRVQMLRDNHAAHSAFVSARHELMEAQRFYDDNRLSAARTCLVKAYGILDAEAERQTEGTFQDAPTPPPPVSAPPRVASDKSPSNGWHVVDRGDPVFTVLTGLRELATSTGDEEAVSAISAVLQLSWSRAHEQHADGSLPDSLQSVFDAVNNMLAAWSQSIGELLAAIQDGAAAE